MTAIDLSTAVFIDNGFGDYYGKYESGKIVTDIGDPRFVFPGLDLDPAKTYDFTFTFETPPADMLDNLGFVSATAISAATQTAYDNDLWWDIFSRYGDEASYVLDGDMVSFQVGPGIEHWDDAVDDYTDIFLWFKTNAGNATTAISYIEVGTDSTGTDTSNFGTARCRGGLGIATVTPAVAAPPVASTTVRVDKAVAFPNPTLVDGRPT